MPTILAKVAKADKAGEERFLGAGKRVDRKMAYPEGLEPPTPWSVAKCSIQLSHGYAQLFSPKSVPHAGSVCKSHAWAEQPTSAPLRDASVCALGLRDSPGGRKKPLHDVAVRKPFLAREIATRAVPKGLPPVRGNALRADDRAHQGPGGCGSAIVVEPQACLAFPKSATSTQLSAPAMTAHTAVATISSSLCFFCRSIWGPPTLRSTPRIARCVQNSYLIPPIC